MKTTWISPYLKEIHQQEGVSRLLGSTDSDILIIAPVPGQEELNQNLPWCSKEAVWFFDMFGSYTGLTPDDLLIMPTTFDGKKPVQVNTSLGTRIIQAAAKSVKIKFFICIGGDAFKPYFGFGKKPPQSIFTGTPVSTRETGYKPLFTFPSPTLVLQNDYGSKRDFALAMKTVMQTQARYTEIIQKIQRSFL